MRKPDVTSVAAGAVAGLVGAALALWVGTVLGAVPWGIGGVLVAGGMGTAGAWFIEARAARRGSTPASTGGRAGAQATAPGSWHVAEGEAKARAAAGDGVPLLGDIRESVCEIAEAAKILGDSSRSMANGASDQAGTVSRTTNTVEALSDRIDRISQNAEEAAEATEGTREQAMRGLEQIQGIIDGMDRLRALAASNARKARRLGERSLEIGPIVKLIDEISNRTDMLALNATIESVRAGEHGRGFAVVAEEIRKLAERTATGTREIGTLVEAIQADTNESIRALAEEESQMDQEARRVREAGSALERISRMAEDSARLVEGISLSASDQVRAARDLVAGMQRISEVSTLVLGDAAQIRREAGVLVSWCDRLRALIGARRPMVAAVDPAEFDGESGGHPVRTRHRPAVEAIP